MATTGEPMYQRILRNYSAGIFCLGECVRQLEEVAAPENVEAIVAGSPPEVCERLRQAATNAPRSDIEWLRVFDVAGITESPGTVFPPWTPEDEDRKRPTRAGIEALRVHWSLPIAEKRPQPVMLLAPGDREAVSERLSVSGAANLRLMTSTSELPSDLHDRHVVLVLSELSLSSTEFQEAAMAAVIGSVPGRRHVLALDACPIPESLSRLRLLPLLVLDGDVTRSINETGVVPVARWVTPGPAVPLMLLSVQRRLPGRFDRKRDDSPDPRFRFDQVTPLQIEVQVSTREVIPVDLEHWNHKGRPSLAILSFPDGDRDLFGPQHRCTPTRTALLEALLTFEGASTLSLPLLLDKISLWP
ncbi:MAG: hypothetical protein IT452_04785 [Planctomycetia bacterium]|nr:hypothetical protein [Planctomycetia bacterium]